MRSPKVTILLLVLMISTSESRPDFNRSVPLWMKLWRPSSLPPFLYPFLLPTLLLILDCTLDLALGLDILLTFNLAPCFLVFVWARSVFLS